MPPANMPKFQYTVKLVNCDKMAVWLLIQETSTQLNEKTKSKLIDNYLKSATEGCNECLQHLKGTVQQLYIEGRLAQVDATWDQCMTYNMVNNSDDDTKSQE